MCDLLSGLKAKLEVFRRCGPPGFDRFGTGHPVERVVDLNTVQPTRIISQELLVGYIRRIEDRLPFFITKTRRAEPDPRHFGITAQRSCLPVVSISAPDDDTTQHPGKLGRFTVRWAL